MTEFDIQATGQVFDRMGLDSVALIADAIQDYAESQRLTESTVQKLSRAPLGMDRTPDQVRAALSVLAREGALSVTKVVNPKGGRPSERVLFNQAF